MEGERMTTATVMDYQTGETLRTATVADLAAARTARGATGTFACPVTGESVYLDGVPHDGVRYGLAGAMHAAAVAMAGDVSALVRDDGTGDLYTITLEALRADPAATAEHIAEIVRESREEWAAECDAG
jgi:hypothetical protein